MRLRTLGILGAAVIAAACSNTTDTTNTQDDATACASQLQIDPFKELVIVDQEIVEDRRSLNRDAGPWSFRYLIEQMAGPGVEPSTVVMSWLRTWIDRTTYNGHSLDMPNERRDGMMMAEIICPWLKETPANECDATCGSCRAQKLDLAKAPFRLLGIIARLDKRHAHPSQLVGDSGEGRLVFALTKGPGDDPASLAQPFTVIFEYGLPRSKTLKEWATAWHGLSAYPDHSEEYKAALEQVTNAYTARGTSPERPMGNSLAQLRTNESLLNWIWQLREFNLTRSGALDVTSTKDTPLQELNNSPTLATWVQKNADLILAEKAAVPESLLGGSSNQFLFNWEVPGVDPRVRRAFAMQTCSGCHSGENPSRDVAFHISPYQKGRLKLSPFMFDPDGRLMVKGTDEVSKRIVDIKSALCQSK